MSLFLGEERALSTHNVKTLYRFLFNEVNYILGMGEPPIYDITVFGGTTL